MPDNEPNGTPAASADTAGQRPTDGTNVNSDPQQPTGDSATSGQQPNDGQQPEVQNPEAKKAADEAAKYRTQLRAVEKRLAEYEAKEQAAKDAELPAIERAEKRAAESERRLADTTRAMQERIVGLMIEVQAGKLNIIDPDAAVKLMDWTALEYDDDGVPTNAAKVLADLVKARPYLVATPAAQATNGAQAAGNAPTDANSALAAHLGATNAERQNGPVTVTANQYLDKTFRADFKLRYGMELDKAVLSGKATIV